MCYHSTCTMHLHIRDLPDEIHTTLKHRAAERGMSLRQYTIEVLSDHCALPTMNEWLDELEELPPLKAEGGMSAVEALEQAREEDDEEILRRVRGSS